MDREVARHTYQGVTLPPGRTLTLLTELGLPAFKPEWTTPGYYVITYEVSSE